MKDGVKPHSKFLQKAVTLFPNNSMECTINAEYIQCTLKSKAHSMQCTFNGIHIQWNTHSMEYTFNAMHIQWNTHSVQDEESFQQNTVLIVLKIEEGRKY